MVCVDALGKQYKDPTAVALGFFDGVHVGHRQVIAHTLNKEGLTPACFSFHLPGKNALLNTDEEKRAMLRQMGVQVLFCPDFTDFCGMTPQQFVTDVLVGTFNARFVCCGYDFTFGKNKSGNVQILQQLCSECGIQVQVVDNVLQDGVSVHSTKIKEFLQEGDVRRAAKMLGYRYGFTGEVIHGRQLGRKMHFPTINTMPPADKILPKFGVYATLVPIGDKLYPAITNIGVKPTVSGSTPLIETHILGFEGDLYGETATVLLEDFVRPEVKFEGVEALRLQIKKDVETVKKLYNIL